ncbi:BTAD domain-containing putative transcriptional regulator [Streptomyces sp. NPDC021020]|uniref:AfsR/SARP family transcriptional regulator n=1 Tax=Streptomyces sp. NPDC021020 TaxID=3365109 RepID=UPI00379CCF80
MPSGIDFCVLGPLAVRCGQGTIDFHGNRQQVLLAALLLEANRVVTADRLVDAVWGHTPPVSARSQVRICVSQIRRKLAEYDGGGLVETHSGGYLIRVPPQRVDLYRFQEHAGLGRSAAKEGDPDTAAEHLRKALDEWNAPVPIGFAGEWARFLLVKLEEDRCAVAEEYIAVMLALGRHREIVGELLCYAAEFPFRESLSAQLMLALHRSGRTTDALDLFRRTRLRFVTELGIEPGPELRRMKQHVLDGTAGRPAVPDPGPRQPGSGAAAPRTEAGDSLADRLLTLEREVVEMRSGLHRLLRASESRPSSR